MFVDRLSKYQAQFEKMSKMQAPLSLLGERKDNDSYLVKPWHEHKQSVFPYIMALGPPDHSALQTGKGLLSQFFPGDNGLRSMKGLARGRRSS